MGVMLDPAANPHPTEEEIARAAGLVPGSSDEAKFLAMRSELDEKGFLVASLDDLATWAPFNQPLKLYEYLACGLPVVASQIQAAEELGDLVQCVREPADWIPSIERALSQNDPVSRERRRGFANENRWERRVSTLEEMLAERFRGSAMPTIATSTSQDELCARSSES